MYIGVILTITIKVRMKERRKLLYIVSLMKVTPNYLYMYNYIINVCGRV